MSVTPKQLAKEWRTTPTDLAGWAMRAEAMRQRAERAEAEMGKLREAVRVYDGVMKQAIMELSQHSKELSGWQTEPINDAVVSMQAARRRFRRITLAATAEEEE